MDFWRLFLILPMLGCQNPSDDETAKPAVTQVRITRTAGDDWPAFLGPTGDSKSRETGILTSWPEKGPPIVWQRKLDTSYGMPTISRGRLFHFDRRRDKARIICLESETGAELWRFAYPTKYEDIIGYDNGPRCSPIVDGDRVYAFGVEGMLHCLRVDNGELIWKVDTQADFGVVQNFFGVGSTPVIEGDLLIAQIGGSPPEDANLAPGNLSRVTGNGSGIVAFDKLTGRVKYKITDELASYASPTLATIHGRRWCFVFARGGLVGFEPATGKIDFQFPWRATILESVNASNPVVIDDEVFISETYGPGSALLRVRPGNCEVVWSDSDRRRQKSMQLHWNTAVHVDGYLYGSSGRHEAEAELRCIELATGKIMWSEPDLRRSSLLYADGHFICLSEDGVLRMLRVNPEKFEMLSAVVLVDKDPTKGTMGFDVSRLLKPPAWAAPILSHGLLYVRGRDRLVCLKLIPAKK